MQVARTYRVYHGTHIGPDAEGNVREIQAARHGDRNPNDTITTRQNLLELNGPQGFTPKFGLVDELPTDEESLLREKERIDAALAQLKQGKPVQAAATSPAQARSLPNLDKMNGKELREWAEDAEIDIEGCKTDADIRTAIKKANA